MYLIYDGDCPLCSMTAQAVKIKKAAGHLKLINAREDHPLVEQVRERGLDLNEGIVVVHGSQFYHGSAAMQFLALSGTPSDFFNRLNIILFRYKMTSYICYPLFRMMRMIILKLKGIKKL